MKLEQLEELANKYIGKPLGALGIILNCYSIFSWNFNFLTIPAFLLGFYPFCYDAIKCGYNSKTI